MSDQLEPELERVARMLAAAGPLPDAPATLRERALAIPDGAASAEASESNVVPIARRPRRRPRAAVLAGIAAVVAAIVIVPTVMVLQGGGPRHVALDARSFAPKASGSASVATHADGSATIVMRVRGLPRQAAGRTYEAWLGREGDRLALGTFSTRADGSASVSFKLARGELGAYRWLWVTSEPTGGSAQPSNRTALWGSLT